MGLYSAFYGGAKSSPVGVGLNLVGSGLRAFGAIEAANAEARGYEHSAETAELAAKDIAKRGKYESWRRDLAMRQARGTQLATYGTLGVEIQDTAIENLTEMAKEMTMAKLMSERTSRIQVFSEKKNAEYYRSAARSTRRAGMLNAIGSFL